MITILILQLLYYNHIPVLKFENCPEDITDLTFVPRNILKEV